MWGNSIWEWSVHNVTLDVMENDTGLGGVCILNIVPPSDFVPTKNVGTSEASPKLDMVARGAVIGEIRIVDKGDGCRMGLSW